jgi:ribonuclease P protein component
MLAKKFKLPIQKGLKENQKVFNFLKGKYFNLKNSKNNLDYSRFGVIVSSKIIKKAFLRNRLKRIVFEMIRNKKLYLISGEDVLIISLPMITKSFSAKPFDGKEIIKELEINLEKVFKSRK